MIKHIASFCLMAIVVFTSSSAHASTKKKKKKSRFHASTNLHKVSKHSRKSRRFHHGTGPDLKSITKDSPYYKEDPNNGITPLETKQP